MVDLSFLPSHIKLNLERLNFDKLYEIRLRKNREILIFYMDKYQYLCDILPNTNDTICLNSDIETIIDNLTEHSVYAYNEQIKNGFITTKCGIRVGICGDIIFDNNKIKTINNFSSLNIRIPHEIENCSYEIFNEITSGQTIKNTLIISPPFMGKTTILKDLIIKINDKLKKQILIIDERGEFENIEGDFIDKICYSTKKYALNNGIRSISPEIIVTDEIKNDDFLSIKEAKNSGVKVVATCHASSIEEVKNLEFFDRSIFDLYFLLEKSDKKGMIKNIYNKEMTLIK